MRKQSFIRTFAAGAFAATTISCLAAYQDPLDVPASPSALGTNTPMVGIAGTDSQLVTVGRRGQILRSTDRGQTWKQAPSPVSSDLVAVYFPTAEKGWAVGHDGIVLHSGDGGKTWRKQLDGKMAAKAAIAYYSNLVQKGQLEAKPLLADAQRYADEGPIYPFLDVWFENEQTGYVIGAFGQIFGTENGGKTWLPLMDKVDNPNGLHLYGIRGVGEQMYIVGEQGLILRLDREKHRFIALKGPYQGTYFGLIADKSLLLAFGMRGNVFRSVDQGNTWTQVSTGTTEGISGGTRLNDARIVLATQGGNLLISKDQGASFSKQMTTNGHAFSGIATANEGVAMVAAQGVSTERLKK